MFRFVFMLLAKHKRKPEISTVVTFYRDNNNCYVSISYGTLREYYDMYRLVRSRVIS